MKQIQLNLKHVKLILPMPDLKTEVTLANGEMYMTAAQSGIVFDHENSLITFVGEKIVEGLVCLK